MSKLARIGVSLDEDLLAPFDGLCRRKGYFNRSEAIRDLIRKALVEEEAGETALKADGHGAGTLSLLYDHHKNDLARQITRIQHDDHDIVAAALHVHLDHNNCLEVLVMNGETTRIRALADRLLSRTGVKNGFFNLLMNGRELA
ncbi:MAG: nickel-responsive transcriptional regulator NikR [Desulfovibrio sp.]|jgi:CopG family nickel-responsive transcriptional regulator|nr:nickel-responsive transcriptional regulator NikR [Desulfovibrio sp.]